MCFIFSVAPESFEELKSLLSGKSIEEQLLVVERIQKCNHPSLAVGNKAKLEVRWRQRAASWELSPALSVGGSCLKLTVTVRSDPYSSVVNARGVQSRQRTTP